MREELSVVYVKVYMLGRFEIITNGIEVIRRLGTSRKRIILLEYLILNRDRPVLTKELLDLLWPGDNSLNPESALKTLVSRLRATLADYSPDLVDCIITERGGYRWNPALSCEIDVSTFEEACNNVLKADEATPEARAEAAKFMDLYAGELLPDSSMDAWVIPHSVTLHNLYLKTVRHYAALLKKEDAYDEIVDVCRLALDVDPFDAMLNLELMTALLKVGRNDEALALYDYAAELHYNHLSFQPPEGMLAFYDELLKIDAAAEEDVESIRSMLCTNDIRPGAFVCDYAIFKDVYQLHMRSLSRLGATMFVALITLSHVGSEPEDKLMSDKLMRLLQNALQTNLRRGDTISRYSPTQYVVLLPSVNYTTGRIPLERVKKAFYKMYSNPSFVLSYRLAPVTPEQ